MNKIYYLASTYNGLEGGFVEPINRYFKGTTEITFDLSDAAEGEFAISKLIVDFNDGSPLYVREYSFGDDRKVVREPIKHTYHPSPNTQHIYYYPTIYITYSNFKKFAYQTPFRITKESFFTEHKNISVVACQFTDTSDNTMFVVLESSNGDNFNLTIK